MASQSTQQPAPRDWVYPGQRRPADDERVIDLDAERPRVKHRPKH